MSATQNRRDEVWPDAKIAKLRTLWEQELSTAEIGRRMGISKNSVVSKSRRLDLPGRQSPIIRDGRQSKKRPQRAPKPSSLTAQNDRHNAPMPEKGVYVPPVILTARTCQWPLWPNNARPTHTYCGAACAGSWCDKHHAKVFEKRVPLKLAGEA